MFTEKDIARLINFANPPIKLGRFGHSPDPANDFCIEVQALQSIVTDKEFGLRQNEPLPERRMRNAMAFRVGGDAIAVAAKKTLRDIEKRLKVLQEQSSAG